MRSDASFSRRPRYCYTSILRGASLDERGRLGASRLPHRSRACHPSSGPGALRNGLGAETILGPTPPRASKNLSRGAATMLESPLGQRETPDFTAAASRRTYHF